MAMAEEQAPVSWLGRKVTVTLTREPMPEGQKRVVGLPRANFPNGELRGVNEFGVTLFIRQPGPQGERIEQTTFYPWTSIRSIRLTEENEPV